jgi:hypothetical protein
MSRTNFHISFENYFHPQIATEHLFKQLSVMADLSDFLRAALEDCGHLVSVGVGDARKDAINIYFEWFLKSPQYSEMLKVTGRRFGIICTELLTEDRRYSPFDHDVDRSRMIFENFARDARFADFVWCLMEESVPICRAINPNSHFLPLGFVERSKRLAPRDPADCYIDFLMSGVLNQRRADFVAALTRSGYRALAVGLQPEHIRDSLLECARVSLSIQKTDAHQIFSFGRINHALVNKIPLVLEYDGPTTYLSKYCRAASPANYLDACIEFLKQGSPTTSAAELYDAFRREMPMRPIMEALLADTQRQFGKLASPMELDPD